MSCTNIFNAPDLCLIPETDPGGKLDKRDMIFFLKKTEAAVKGIFAPSRGSHDWDHTLRVYRLCRHIGAKENADIDVLSIAAYLHDIGRRFEDESKGSICHAEKGAEMAEAMITDLPFSEKQKKNILHCILSHRFRGKHMPTTLEAKVLFDADKIDAIGAIGVARAFLFAGEIGARLHNADADVHQTLAYSTEDTGYREYVFKLSKIKARIMTAEGKIMASQRHAFMEMFFNRFLDEFGGKR
jgi:uncharacterized protein